MNPISSLLRKIAEWRFFYDYKHLDVISFIAKYPNSVFTDEELDDIERKFSPNWNWNS